MVDQMVLKAQKWVNTTYGSVPGYNPCDETGRTGWDTMFSLTRALQHELGITTLSDNFGPTTFALLSSYGPVGVRSSNNNMRIIAEAALYCKGYSGGDIDGEFGTGTQPGLTSIVQDMGLATNGFVDSVSPKVFKALLNMDAYVLTGDGSEAVQKCQRWLNWAYSARGEFFIGPCDGHFSRNVQTALVYAIQYQMGLTDSQVTGSIGPGTRGGLQSQATVRNGSQDSGQPGWVRLFQCALAFNGYKNNWVDSAGTFNSEMEFTVKVFQRFCMLAETGAGDYQTWMSLLVSTGDPERFGNAIDCMMPLNSARLETVKNRGHKIVGRYLTGGTNKVLTHSEIALIIENGLSFFPIYQEYGDGIDYFTYSQGKSAGAAACAAAHGFGLPRGTVIYFSVDYDAQDSEITSSIIPHFQGVRDAFEADGNQYAIGVYGCRNVCLRLQSAGLTTRSFVSGMSAGFSGNLGFRLPDNWAFDQIKNLTLAAGTPGEIEIDNDMVSGRDLGVTSVTRPQDPNDGFYTMLTWLEARAGQWREQHGQRSAPELVAQWLRVQSGKFDFFGSSSVFGELDAEFIDFVRGYPGRPDDRPLRDPKYLWDCDIEHLGASFGAVLTHDLVGNRGQTNLADFGTWGGDALSVLGLWHQSGLPVAQAYDFATDRLGTRADNTFLSLDDYMADADAWVLGQQSRANPDIPLSTLIRQAYASPASASSRFASFFARRFNSDAGLARAAANSMFDEPGDSWTGFIRDEFWRTQFGGLTNAKPSSLPGEARDAVARAFADLVVRFARA